MSAPKRPLDDQDPDYVSPAPTNAKQQKIYEEAARSNTAKKITQIVEREFAKEIDSKEKEVLEIQNRLQKALKTLHLLRYVVITDFYNRKQCQAPQAPECKQTQIHPVIKRLIGKTPKRHKINSLDPGPSTSVDSRCSPDVDQDDVETQIKKEIHDTCLISEVKKRLGQIDDTNAASTSGRKDLTESEDESDNGKASKKIPRYIPPRSSDPAVLSPSRGVRHKVRKRIIVGNISKWIPPDWREDGASHKWMMYVRGSKEMPDISDFVSKVRFFLHPSYQPNDVVEVTSSPFHLSRRGWGEFPLRVQLHFKNILNKPMDIIHYLKLDRTYTGLQTLGSETVVDTWIHTSTPHCLKKMIDPDQSVNSTSESNIEADRCKMKLDLSIVKKEPGESLNSADRGKMTVKQEVIDNCNPKVNPYPIDDRCIKIEHNYVSKACEEPRSEIVYATEDNVTIKHSPSATKREPVTPTDFELTKNTVQSVAWSIDESTNSLREANDNSRCDETLPQYEAACNGLENEHIVCATSEYQQISDNDDSPNIFCVPDNDACSTVWKHKENTGNASDIELASKPDSKIENSSRRASGSCENAGDISNLSLNLPNGRVSPIPIKLVKHKDKYFLTTNIAKLKSNKIDFVKTADSGIAKTILAKKLQPTKLALRGVMDATSTKVITLNNVALSKVLELSNGQNEAQKEIKPILANKNMTSISTVGKVESTRKSENSSNSLGVAFSKPQHFESLDIQSLHSTLLKNSSHEPNLQKLASSLKSIPSKSEPLRITIPPAFEPKVKKQILLVKNNKLISINANSSTFAMPQQSVLRDKIQEFSGNQMNNKMEFVKTNHGQISLLNMKLKPAEGTSILKPSLSLLKKPAMNNLVTLDAGGQNKAPTVLKINSSNSLLLNSSSNIPILQIAPTRLQISNTGDKDFGKQNRLMLQKVKKLSKTIKLDDPDESKGVKVKVTIGKDKHKILSKRDTYEDILRSIDTVQIPSMVGALSYIMKRIPLITQDAKDLDYKQMHPYACATREEFLNFNIGKQKAHEWYRAKMARSVLRKKGFKDDELWSVKEILYWARLHGYTPVEPSLAIDNIERSSKKLLETTINRTATTCTEPVQFAEWLENCKDSNSYDDEDDIEVDVVCIEDTKIKSEADVATTNQMKNTITLEIEPTLESPCNFVAETAREIGIRLQKEEIIPGVMHRTVERVLLQAVQCLVDDLTRRSLSKAWQRNNNRCPGTIILDDVRDALLSREEFDLFTNTGLGSLQNSS